MYCRGQLVELQKDQLILQHAGFGLAAISYDGEAVLREFALRKSITFPLLADHGSNVIRAFDVANRRFAKGTLLDVRSEQITDSLGDVPVFGVAYPAVFVIDRAGKILWRFVSETDELRLTGAAIIARSVGSSVDQSRHALVSGLIQLAVTASNADVYLGNRVQLAVAFKLPPGFHLYGSEVGQNYYGLKWTMEESSCWYQSDPKYPSPELRHFSFADDALPVYTANFRLTRELVLKPALSLAEPSLFQLFKKVCLDANARVKAAGVVRFQACDERQCYPPQSVPLEWRFHFIAPDLERASPELRREFER